MKAFLAIGAIAMTLLCGGCGGDAATTSGETGSTNAAETRSEPSPSPPAETRSKPPPSPPPSAAGSRRPSTVFPAAAPADDPRFATITFGGGGHPKPEIVPPNAPPPRKVLVRDLRAGSGPVARAGDEVGVFYIGVAYGTGKKQFQTWPPTAHPFFTQLRSYGSAEGWERGIMGMREGGRREVLVPSRLAFDNGALDYLFVMARLKPAGKSPPPG
jgi:peptidylprolyl isomerase